MGDELPPRGADVLDFFVPIIEGRHRDDATRRWRLPEGAGARLLELVEASTRAGEPLLRLLNGGGPDAMHVVWIPGGRLVVKFAKPESRRHPLAEPPWWSMDVRYSESRSYAWTLFSSCLRTDHILLVYFLHKAIAHGSGIRNTTMGFDLCHHAQNAYFLPALRDLVALPRGRRTVQFNFRLTPHAQREIAFHCSPSVELDVFLCGWDGFGGALADAMRNNQGPARLAVRHVSGNPWHVLAPALEATTGLEELTVYVQCGPSVKAILDAVGRNRGIRHLVAKQEGPVTAGLVQTFWTSVMKCPTLQSVDTSYISGGSMPAGGGGGGARPGPPPQLSKGKRRECAALVARLMRTNRRITSVAYHPRAHAAHIMEARVVSVAQLNRFRPVVEAALDDDTATAGTNQDRSLSSLVGSPLVRSRPQLMYFLLRAFSDRLVGPAAPSGGPAAPSSVPCFRLGRGTTSGSGRPGHGGRPVRVRRHHGRGGPGQLRFGDGRVDDRAEPPRSAALPPSPGNLGPMEGSPSAPSRRRCCRARRRRVSPFGALWVTALYVLVRAGWQVKM